MTDTTFSPLARDLQRLFEAGIIPMNSRPMNDFPTTMIVLPIFDSGDAVTTRTFEGKPADAKLARRTY